VSDQQSTRPSLTDGLGRVVALVEGPAGKNYSTAYAYDVLDDLPGVTQSRGADQTTMSTRSLRIPALLHL
jgi:hypothetical protein